MTDSSPNPASTLVLVAGATGGVGQLTVAQLLTAGYPIRVLSRSAEKARRLFENQVEVAIGDIRQAETLPAATQGVTHMICCTGTTALPSDRWDFQLPEQNGLEQLLSWGKIYLDADYRQAKARNSPEVVDGQGVEHLLQAAPEGLQRFVFVSSAGVERRDQLPYSLLNAFGVLDAKHKGEAAIRQSGLPYTIFRPGRLIDGPYTSTDLNTLLKAKTDGKLGVVLAMGDRLNGQTSRIDVAAACVACLGETVAENQTYEIISQGKRPEQIDWRSRFCQAQT
ncbi:SDR family oxidoreductase [Romeria aff. gracilis LEGE 07310]|uniref:SDR family oxidoreductase n=1 Tax=Vasconcelosia minhoensis LEGE 07310 TaxID=915328 RepID=A0A8J7AHT8_9CYAN|nr:SDR family oxidoreductase [Romeria gracilis]MBE9079376.1 SDR family oxidoreductase [Romeria aff. gracilis LEGE 07310]